MELSSHEKTNSVSCHGHPCARQLVEHAEPRGDLGPGVDSVRPALEKLIPQFESKTGYKVNVTWARGPASKERVASGDIFDAAIMTGPIGDVLASGQVVISSVKTLAGLKLSVTVRQGAPSLIFPPSKR